MNRASKLTEPSAMLRNRSGRCRCGPHPLSERRRTCIVLNRRTAPPNRNDATCDDDANATGACDDDYDTDAADDSINANDATSDTDATDDYDDSTDAYDSISDYDSTNSF